MNGKAVIMQSVDSPTVEALRVSFNVSFFSTAGFVTTENIDVPFSETDTLAQMKTKVRQTMVARGAELGLIITAQDVGSIMQI